MLQIGFQAMAVAANFYWDQGNPLVLGENLYSSLKYATNNLKTFSEWSYILLGNIFIKQSYTNFNSQSKLLKDK
jgi:hypothetical protein